MGHLSSSGPIYEKLGAKLNNLISGCPWNENLRAILVDLYSEEDADVVTRMPYSLASFDRLVTTTGYERTHLRKVIDRLVERGLVVDLLVRGENFYMASPLIVGFFEFTMMKRADPSDHKRWARLFSAYMADNTFFEQFNDSEVGILRTLPHEGTLAEDSHVEVLDYELAEGIIHDCTKFAVEICSCRHEKFHLGEKRCNVPLEHCTSIGTFADSVIRNGFGREISRTEMKELCAESKELGLILCADNVKKRPSYICHCCGCCCGLLGGLNRFGHTNVVVSSNYLPKSDVNKCSGCGRCKEACHVHAVKMVTDDSVSNRKHARPAFDATLCLGCGVCVSRCSKQAIRMIPREKRRFVPENTFHRLILQYLESGKLEFQIFDNPEAVTHRVMRAFLGGFLRLPLIKRAALSKALGSIFLAGVGGAARLQGRGWVRDL